MRRSVFGTIILLASLPGGEACLAGRLSRPSAAEGAGSEYTVLLARFPADLHGGGIDPYGFSSGLEEQPMTAALALSAEALHERAFPNPASRDYVRTAALWLLEYADADGDGRPGWGLPDPWDAFGDGSVNPAHQPYTITTALVLNAILDALRCPSLWTEEEKARMDRVLSDVALRWCRGAWTDTESGGFFWYSPNPADAYFVPNVSSMFLGSLARLLSEQRSALEKAKAVLFEEKTGKAAREIIAKMQRREGAPFWSYIVWPSDSGRPETPNDLVHQAYTLWGMEIYRSSPGGSRLPWSRRQSLASLEAYREDSRIYNYPRFLPSGSDFQAMRSEPAVLWGAGMMLAFYARWGSRAQAESCWRYIREELGPPPELRLWPKSYKDDPQSYPRHAAHVLWALAIRDFYR